MKLNHILCALVGILSFAFSSSLSAQVRIDVKTKWLEKKELTAAKQGIIAAINAAPSTAVTEFGEDYALWIKNLHRAKGMNDTVVVTLDLELRKPSFVSQGDLIAKHELVLRYDPRSLDSLRLLGEVSTTIAACRREYEYWNRLIGTAVANVVPKGGTLVAPVVTAVLQKVNQAPTLEEFCEAVLIGVAAAEWMDGEIVVK